MRDRAAARLWQQLTQLTNADQQVNLDTLLQVPEGEHTPWTASTSPSRVSGPGLVAALHRLDAIRALGVSDISLDHLPLNRLRALSQVCGARPKPSAAWRLNAERQPSSPLRMRLSGRQWMMPSTCWMGWLATSSGALIKKVKRNDSAPA